MGATACVPNGTPIYIDAAAGTLTVNASGNTPWGIKGQHLGPCLCGPIDPAGLCPSITHGTGIRSIRSILGI